MDAAQLVVIILVIFLTLLVLAIVALVVMVLRLTLQIRSLMRSAQAAANTITYALLAAGNARRIILSLKAILPRILRSKKSKKRRTNE